jgi:class 3 adenylate cyclase
MTDSSTRDYTVVFADVCRSTFLFNELGDDKATRVINLALEIARHAVTANEGRVIGTIGDELLSIFREPGEAMDAARQIHSEVAENTELQQHGLKFRIGLNSGPILVSEDSIHGDTVNTAARLADTAKAAQSIASAQSIEGLASNHGQNLRQMGSVSVRGKSGSTEIYEVLSQADEEEITEVRRVLRTRSVATSITLKFQSQQTRLDHMMVRFSLGRLPSCDLVVNHPSISRLHAEIRYINGEFMLQDFSTNGTQILTAAGPQTIQRRAISLKGSGTIFLGQTSGDRHLAVEYTTFGG